MPNEKKYPLSTIHYPLKLKPVIKDYIWGGTKLKTLFSKEGGDRLAEAWEVSCHKDGPSVIVSGEYAGRLLSEFIAENPACTGTRAKKFNSFPMLVKLIDSREDLSVQVHPSDAFALRHEKQYGKTECWYIISAEPGAGIYYGFNRDVSREEFKKAIEENRVTELLNFIKVNPGEIYYLPAGTVHAIGRGVTLCEAQQNSNLTYRVYDFNRLGPDGKPRELHIDKALAVSNLSRQEIIGQGGLFAVEKNGNIITHMAHDKYFSVYELRFKRELRMTMNERSFNSVTFLRGEGTITCGGIEEKFKPGDSFFIPCPAAGYTIKGTGLALMCKLEGDNTHKTFDK